MKLSQQRLKELLTYDPRTGTFRWRVRHSKLSADGFAGTIKADGYRQIRIEGQSYYASRLAWFYMTGYWPISKMDHKNCNRSDNRFANLRLATDGESAYNRGVRRDKKSGLPKGVSHSKNGYRAHIRVKYQGIFLGYFPTIELAAAAYAKAAKKLHGSFARTN